MAAVFGRTEVQLKRTGVSASVPESPTAKLMYYFNCVCGCVEPDEDYSIRRLRSYNNYSSLSNEEQAKLLVLCIALSPDKLIGSIFFPAEDDAFERNNEFFELSAVSTRLVVAQSLLIGGQQKQVKKIMMFKKNWIEKYYLAPLRSFTEGSRRALPQPSPQRLIPQRLSPQPQRPAPQRPNPQRQSPQRPNPQRPSPQPQRPAPQRPNPQRPNPQRPRPNPQRPNPQRPNPQQRPPQRRGGGSCTIL